MKDWLSKWWLVIAWLLLWLVVVIFGFKPEFTVMDKFWFIMFFVVAPLVIGHNAGGE